MQNGAAAEKVEAVLGAYKKNPLFSLRERLALELAEEPDSSRERIEAAVTLAREAPTATSERLSH